MSSHADRADPAYRVVWEPNPGPQEWLLSCPVFELFFGGARGGGKSDGMLGDFASHADEFGESAIGLVIRRELTQLKELIERSKQIYGPLGAVWHVGEKMWRFPNGARLTFAYIDNDDDADKYQGNSYSRIYVEELGNFPSPVPIFKLMACIRSANPAVRCGFRATGNPGGPGHLWIKQRYIMPAPRGMQIIKSKFINPFTKEEFEQERVFIPSKITDNKYNNNPQYIARLQMVGNARLVDAWLLGNWDIIEGAYFDEWDERKHVIDQFIIPAHWTRFTSMDWGSARPFSVGWWALVPDRFDLMTDHTPSTFDPRFQYKNNLPRGALVRYREWYGCQVDGNGASQHNNVGLKLTVEQLASGIAEREKREPVNDQDRPRIALRVADPSIFKEDGGPSIAERMSASPYYQFWTPADNTRVGRRGAMGGWDMVRSRLIGEGGEPMIYFFPNNIDSIRTLPALQHDKNNIEDVDTDGEDHCFAAGTIVDTVNGPVTIERLPSDGFVHSVNGAEAYRSARLVKKGAEVVRLTFDDGKTIVCTPDHGFLVDTNELRYAAFLNGESVLCSQLLSVARSKSLTASGIISVADTFNIKASAFTSRFGNITMGLFQKATTFITKKLGLITHSTILSALLSTNILAVAMALNQRRTAKPLFQKLRPPPPFGIGQTKENLGTQNTMKKTSAPRWSAEFPRHVGNVVVSSWLSKFTRLGPNSAAKTAKRVRCVSVEWLPDRQDVYCLTVPSSGLFSIEGGILVSNCPDEIRYMCSARPYSRQNDGGEKGRIMSVGPDNQLQIKDVMGDFEPQKDVKFVPYKRI